MMPDQMAALQSTAVLTGGIFSVANYVSSVKKIRPHDAGCVIGSVYLVLVVPVFLVRDVELGLPISPLIIFAGWCAFARQIAASAYTDPSCPPCFP